MRGISQFPLLSVVGVLEPCRPCPSRLDCTCSLESLVYSTADETVSTLLRRDRHAIGFHISEFNVRPSVRSIPCRHGDRGRRRQNRQSSCGSHSPTRVTMSISCSLHARGMPTFHADRFIRRLCPVSQWWPSGHTARKTSTAGREAVDDRQMPCHDGGEGHEI